MNSLYVTTSFLTAAKITTNAGNCLTSSVVGRRGRLFRLDPKTRHPCKLPCIGPPMLPGLPPGITKPELLFLCKLDRKVLTFPGSSFLYRPINTNNLLSVTAQSAHASAAQPNICQYHSAIRQYAQTIAVHTPFNCARIHCLQHFVACFTFIRFVTQTQVTSIKFSTGCPYQTFSGGFQFLIPYRETARK